MTATLVSGSGEQPGFQDRVGDVARHRPGQARRREPANRQPHCRGRCPESRKSWSFYRFPLWNEPLGRSREIGTPALQASSIKCTTEENFGINSRR